MSWFDKLLPPKIQQTDPSERRTVPEGLWIKCPSCESVLYNADLEQNLNVCPKCSHHHRIGARARLNAFLDAEGRYEFGQEVLPVDPLKFKDSKKYPERLKAALEATGDSEKLNEFIDVMRSYGEIEVTRSGVVGVSLEPRKLRLSSPVATKAASQLAAPAAEAIT